MTAAWAAKTDVSTIVAGLAPEEALRQAPEFLRLLREGKLSDADAHLEDAEIDVLHAACRLLAEPDAGGLQNPLADVRNLHDFLEMVAWPGPDFEERPELLADCAFAGWRIARKNSIPGEADEWLRSFYATARKDSSFRSSVEIAHWPGNSRTPESDKDRLLDDPQALLALLESINQRRETNPERALESASFVYGSLQNRKSQDPFAGELAYFLGEAARSAGGACRLLSRRDDARRWFDKAETHLRETRCASADLARLSYSRLTIRLEERACGEVLEAVPRLIEGFDRLGMDEDSLKCRFLEALAHNELGDPATAAGVFEDVCVRAKTLGNGLLLSQALLNLFTMYAELGETARAIATSREALVALGRVQNRVGLALLHRSIGVLLRSHGQRRKAIEAYRTALDLSRELGLRGQVAELRLTVADLLLQLGQEAQAESEIRAALPIIQQEKMVSEALAAASLLQESLHRQRIDRQALRDLRTHFPKPTG